MPDRHKYQKSYAKKSAEKKNMMQYHFTSNYVNYVKSTSILYRNRIFFGEREKLFQFFELHQNSFSFEKSLFPPSLTETMFFSSFLFTMAAVRRTLCW